MSEKYIDLAQPIIDANDAEIDFMCSCYDRGVEAALEYFDEHPGQAPGRTITESQIAEAFGDEYHYWAKRRLSRIGITVVPDPEPTNADKATADLETWGIHRAKALELGPWLAGQGWVKAPGGEGAINHE